MPYDKSPMKKSSCIKMYNDKGKQTGLMMEGSVAHMDHGDSAMKMSPYKMHGDDSTPHPEKKKEAKALTEKQKYRMAATAVGEDPSFTLKTFDDPRSGRSIVETKRSLKKKDPKLYANLYGK